MVIKKIKNTSKTAFALSLVGFLKMSLAYIKTLPEVILLI
jgi:hypothetical protein